MDPVTHTLTGALIGQAGLKRRTGLAMPALIIGANLPDIDVACFLWLDGVQHLGFRRGITHGPIAWVLLPLLLAGALWWFDRWQARRGKRPVGRLPVRFDWLYGLAFVACLTHPALDWLNVYGIRLLEPFSSRWFYGDTLFIIDVWLWLGMGFATWLSLRRETQGGEWRRPARVGIAASLAYVGVNGGITWTAERSEEPAFVTGEEKIASPVPLRFWARDLIAFTPSPTQLFVEPSTWSWSILSGRSGEANSLAANDLPLPCLDRQAYQFDPQAEAFIFWSRVPIIDFTEGQYQLRDARFYDPRTRDRFTVALPDVRCEPLLAP